MIPVLIFLVISAMVGGGASVAAESSLPGDLLYAIKVGINEKVGEALATSAEAKANFDTKIAARRLEEVESLSVKGKVVADAQANIEANFKSYADRVAARVAELEAKGNAYVALEANSDFQSSLNAHKDILVRLAAKDSDDSDKAGLLNLSNRVAAVVTASAIVQSNLEAKIRVDVLVNPQTSAEGKLKAAQNKTDEVRRFLDAKEASVSADVKASAEARLTEANSAIAQGKIKIEAKAYGEAFVLFQRAMRLAQEAKLIISGNSEINLEISNAIRLQAGENKAEENSSENSDNANVEGNGSADVNSGNGGVNVDGSVKVKVGL